MRRLAIGGRGSVLSRLVVFAVLGVATVGAYLTVAGEYYSWADWQSFLINGLALGAVYALIALGYTLVYGILFMINFAHGEVFMAGTFTALFTALWAVDTGIAAAAPWLAFAMTLLTAMTTSMLIAIALERVAYRPLRRAPRLVPLITAIGASLFLQYTFRGMYGAGVQAYPSFGLFTGSATVGALAVPVNRIAVIVAAMALMATLYLFVEHSRTGRAMRAVSEDKDVAAMMGVNVNRVILTTFAIGGLLAGAAGVLYVQLFNQVHYFMGFLPGVKAFTAAVLGGIGNVTGAMLGGVSLGVLESVGPFLLLRGFDVPSPNQLKDVIAFTVLVVVLIARPTGLLGRKEHV